MRAGERLTSRDPHTIDIVVKVTALAMSAGALGLFAAETTTVAGVYGSVGFYAANAGAYASQGYNI